MEIKIARIDKTLPLPKYEHFGEDVGMDLLSREDVILQSGDYRLIKTGIKVAIPQGYGAFVNPRSGLALKHGVTVLNADGVIDPAIEGKLA